MTVRRGDIRTDEALGGGTLYDIGVYCINAARYLFRAEPKEVVADLGQQRAGATCRRSTSRPAPLLRFDGERVAAFVTSFNAADVASYRIVGTKGQLHVDPAYEYAEGLAYELTIDGKTTRKRIGKRDQFAPELLLLLRLHPARTASPSRRAKRACRTCGSSRRSTNPPKRASRRDPAVPRDAAATSRQRIVRPGVRKPSLVKVQSASV